MVSLKVDNLTYRTTDRDLEYLFEKYGKVSLKPCLKLLDSSSRPMIPWNHGWIGDFSLCYVTFILSV